MTRTLLELAGDDGPCPVHRFAPDGAGPWPAVLVLMDGLGMRPAMWELGARLAAEGYLALMPDLFHRMAPYTPPAPATLFTDEAARAAWWKQTEASTSAATISRDLATCLAYLATAPDVRPGPIAVTGYCMGGRAALVAGGTFPDRFAAIAAYHPGRLVTDAADSPHRVAAGTRARVYVAAATDDATFTVEHQAALTAALTAGGVRHLLETYPARHGWVPSDMPVHDPAATARHWQTLLALLADELR